MRLQRACVLALSLLAALVHGQSPTAPPVGVADALRNGGRSLSVTELPEGFRAISLGGEANGLFGSLGFYGLAGMGRTGDPDAAKTSLLFSLVGATLVDPDEFAELLEGKRPRIRGYVLDFTSMIAASTGSAEGSRFPPLRFIETWIEGGHVLQWTPHSNLTKDALVKTFGVTPSDSVANAKARTVSNAKQAALAVILYCSDYDDRFPKGPPPTRPSRSSYLTARTPPSGRRPIQREDACSTTPRSPTPSRRRSQAPPRPR